MFKKNMQALEHFFLHLILIVTRVSSFSLTTSVFHSVAFLFIITLRDIFQDDDFLIFRECRSFRVRYWFAKKICGCFAAYDLIRDVEGKVSAVIMFSWASLSMTCGGPQKKLAISIATAQLPLIFCLSTYEMQVC